MRNMVMVLDRDMETCIDLGIPMHAYIRYMRGAEHGAEGARTSAGTRDFFFFFKKFLCSLS